jgi:hypothetical protein
MATRAQRALLLSCSSKTKALGELRECGVEGFGGLTDGKRPATIKRAVYAFIDRVNLQIYEQNGLYICIDLFRYLFLSNPVKVLTCMN